MNEEPITVEVAYALPEQQLLLSLQVPRGTTAREAVRLSRIAEQFEGLDVEGSPMGIFSRRLNGKDLPLPEDYVLQSRDRIEIYRPLTIDPKQARLTRAKKTKD